MKNKQHKELAVCGFEAVYSLCTHHPQWIERLFFTQDRARFFGDVCKKLSQEKKVYRVVESPMELEKLCQSVHHQGVVAMISMIDIPRLDMEMLLSWQTQKARVLVLDRVGNANNFGAIVRSAAFFGIKYVVISEDDEQAKVTTSTYRVAQGGMDFVEIYSVASAAWLITATAGKMTRIGADHRSKTSVRELPSLTPSSKGVLVVMGNEETGLSPEVKTACDYLVKIPGSGNVESLNVAQAASLFLYELSIITSA